MSPEREQAEILLTKARENHLVLRAIAGDPALPDSAVGFHAQQAVELAFKAVLASRGIDYPWTHDLQLLIAESTATGLDVPDAVGETRALTPWAVAYRYDESPDEGIDREPLLASVEGVLSWAVSTLE